MGLSVFAPNSETVYATNRPEYLRLQFPVVTGWGSVLDSVFGMESTFTRFIAPQAPAGAGAVTRGLLGAEAPASSAEGASPEEAAQDTEFLVAVRGVKLDQAARDRIEDAIRGSVLRVLGGADLQGDLHISSLGRFAKARGIELSPGGATGFVVQVGGYEQLH
jgi:hypothetical protein